ncbi:MAG: universal stress protein [Burkholderiales bacterium]
MNSVVVPIEEWSSPTRAIDYVIGLYRQAPIVIHLVNVRAPLPRYVSRFIPGTERLAFHLENGMRAMRAAIERLDESGVAHREHVLVGNKAESIVQFAHEHGCTQIVLDRPAGNVLDRLGLGSVHAQLHHLVRPGDSCQIHEGA